MPWDEHESALRSELASASHSHRVLFGLALATRSLLAYRLGMTNGGDADAADRVDAWLERLWSADCLSFDAQAREVLDEVERVIPGEDSNYTWQLEQDALITVHSYLRFVLGDTHERALLQIARNSRELAHSAAYDRLDVSAYTPASDAAIARDPAVQDEYAFQRALATDLASARFDDALVRRVRALGMHWQSSGVRWA